jgi:esterase/lipase
VAIFETKEYGKKNKKVIFLLAGWYMRMWTLWPAAKILEKSGYYCICYAYDNAIFSPDVPKTVENIHLIKNDILHRIIQLKNKGYTEFSMAAGSLGTVIALLVANESKDVTKIILNTTGADTAENVWISDMTKETFKKEVVKQGYTLKKLQKAWKTIIPLYNIDNLKDKKLLIYLSEKDTIIPYQLGLKLIHEFENRKYDYKLIINTKLGHLHAALYNSFNAKVYLKFLSNK